MRKKREILDLGSLPKSKAEALSLGETLFYTGIPCKKGHFDAHYTKNGRCRQCQIDATAASHAAKGGHYQYQLQWRKENYQKYREQNTKSVTSRNELIAKMPISARQWDEIRSLEEKARIISLEKGEPYHVDHIIPIKGEFVIGLHWPSNMKIISGRENQKKSSSLPPEHDWVDYSASAWKLNNS